MVDIYCIISGQVQNVAFRIYVQEAAMELGVNGWVKNLVDGTVAVYGQGTNDQLKELIEYLHEGSLRAKVVGVAVEWGTGKADVEDFLIRYD